MFVKLLHLGQSEIWTNWVIISLPVKSQKNFFPEGRLTAAVLSVIRICVLMGTVVKPFKGPQNFSFFTIMNVFVCVCERSCQHLPRGLFCFGFWGGSGVEDDTKMQTMSFNIGAVKAIAAVLSLSSTLSV